MDRKDGYGVRQPIKRQKSVTRGSDARRTNIWLHNITTSILNCCRIYIAYRFPKILPSISLNPNKLLFNNLY